MIAALVLCAAAGAESGTCGDGLAWTLDSGVLTISGTGEMPDYETGEAPWFNWRFQIDSAVMEEGLTRIGAEAFNDCMTMTSVTLPSTLEEIGECAFSSCHGLTQITIPEGVVSIGYSAFSHCSGLTQVTIPASVESMDITPFAMCTNLTSIQVAAGNTAFSAADGVLYSGNVLWTYPMGKTGALTVPEGVEAIGIRAFSYCDGLTAVSLPSTLEEICEGAFMECTGLTGITIPAGVGTIGSEAFAGCTNLTGVTVDADNPVYSSADGVLYSSGGKKLEMVPAGRTGAFVIPYGVRDIATYGFLYSGVSSVVFPDTVNYIDDFAFYSCMNLTSVVLPDGLTGIGSFAFSLCRNLTSVTIPSSVYEICQYAFNACESLTDVYYTGTQEDWEQIEIDGGNEILQSVQMHYGADPSVSGTCGSQVEWTLRGTTLTLSGTGAMADYTAGSPAPWNDGQTVVQAVVAEDGVTGIGARAFAGCAYLTRVTLAESVETIGTNAFSGCTALTRVDFLGTRAQKDEIAIAGGNTALENAEWHCADDMPVMPLDTDVSVTMEEGETVWYQFVPARSGTYVFTSSGWSCDTCGFICIGAASEDSQIAFNEDGPDYFNFQVTAELEAGVTYYLGAKSPYDSGTTKLHLSFYDFTWSLEGGVLTLSGSGQLPDFSFGETPWSARSSEITRAVVSQGVTGIGSFTFAGLAELTDVTIPSTVTEIGTGAFNNCICLTQIALPSGLTSFADYMFFGCSGLTEIMIPAGTTYLGYGTFLECSALTGFTVEAGNTRFIAVDGVVFNAAGTKLVQYPTGRSGVYTIPEGVTHIGEAAFAYCSEVTGVNIASTVTTISVEAFYGTAVESIAIPASVTSISSGAFTGCPSLTGFSVEAGNGSYSAVNGILCSADGSELIAYPYGKTGSCVLPAGITAIGSSAFSGCRVSSVTLPAGVTSIAEYAFADCRMTDLVIEAQLDSLPSGAFSSCTALATVTLPATLTVIGEDAFDYCGNIQDVYFTGTQEQWNSIDFTYGNGDLLDADIHFGPLSEFAWTLENGVLTITGEGPMPEGDANGGMPWASRKDEITSVVIGEGITRIADEAFMSCGSLTSVSIPSTVTRVGNFSFCACPALTDVTLPAGLTKLGYGAFNGCSALTQIALPAGVTELEGYAFAECSSLTAFTIPAGLRSVGFAAFFNCSSLTAFTVEAGNTAYTAADGVLFNADGTKLMLCPAGKTGTYAVPEGVTAIGDSAFASCARLTQVTLPSTLEQILFRAFYGAAGLTGMTIPAGVTQIEEGAFIGCTGITAFTVADSNQYFSAREGSLCNKGGSTLIAYPGGRTGTGTVPACVTVIGPNAFDSSSLTSITIPSTVTSIGEGAFRRSSLTSIVIEASINYIEASMFSYCPNLTSVTLPAGAIHINEYAFYGCDSLTDVYYSGTQEEWDRAVIEEGNEALETATLHIGGDGYAEDIAWTLADHVLTISGHGRMPEYGRYDTPWRSAWSSATSLIVEEGITGLCEDAFFQFDYLTSVSLPSTLKQLGKYAFYGCIGLSEINLPSGVTEIPNRAFGQCTGLTSFTIPAGTTSVDRTAFSESTSLASFSVAAGNTVYSAVNGVLFRDSGANLALCPPAKSGTFAVPQGTVTIMKGAFYDCVNLTQVTLPSGLVEIGDNAFVNCAGLTGTFQIPASVTRIGLWAFAGCPGLTAFQVAAGNPEFTSPDGILCGDGGATLLRYPAGRTGPGSIPAGVTAIEFGSFKGSIHMTSITVPATVTRFDSAVFSGCTALETAVIEADLYQVEASTFTDCTALTSVTLPAGITYVGYEAFRNCTSLTDVYFYGTQEEWDSLEYGYDNTCLQNATVHFVRPVPANVLNLPAGLTAIESEAFVGLYNVDAIRIPASVDNIATNAFDTGMLLLVPSQEWGAWAESNGYTWMLDED